jgi:ABC-type Mn2+/Zn2+ transport system permease subunit
MNLEPSPVSPSPKRRPTLGFVAAELAVSAAYGVALGFGLEGRLIDGAASVVFLAVFLVWLTRDARDRDVDLGMVQKVLFLLAFTSPLMVLWYGIRTRKGRCWAFFGKLAAVGALAVVATAVPFVLIGLFVTHLW